MLRDLIKEGGLYTLANLLTKGLSLLLLPFYADYFTQAEYGILAMLGIAGAVSAAIFSFQLYQGVGRYISEKGLTLVDQQRIGSTGLWFTVLSYVAFFGISLLFKDEIIALLSEDERIQDSTYVWSLVAIVIGGVFNALSVQLKFLRKTKAFAISNFLNAFLTIIFILIFALGLNYRIDSVYMATIAVVPLLILLQIYFLKDYIVLYLGKLELKKLLQFSAPLIPASLAYLILNLTDRIFIKEYSGSLAEVGIYDMAFKFSSIISIIIISFQSALAPIIYEQYQASEAPTQLGRIFKLFIAVGTFGTLTLSFFSFETLVVFTQPDYYAANVLMPLFYLGVFITGFGMFAPGLHVKNKTRMIPIVVGTSALLNCLLNFVLVPEIGLMGAALATLISITFNNLALFILSQKLYSFPFERMKLVSALVLFLLFLFVGSYLDQFITLSWAILFGIKLALLLSYIYLLQQQKLIEIKVIFQKLKRKKSD